MVTGGSRRHLIRSFLSACLSCRSLVDTNVLYVLCCSVQSRLKAVLLCLRYVDITCGWFVPSWCVQKEQVKKWNETKGKKLKEANKKQSRDLSGKKKSPSAITGFWVLALSHSGRHDRTAVRTLLLCAGPIARWSAVHAVRRHCDHRSLVWAAFDARYACSGRENISNMWSGQRSIIGCRFKLPTWKLPTDPPPYSRKTIQMLHAWVYRVCTWYLVVLAMYSGVYICLSRCLWLQSFCL